ncbi:hypothetical protein TWF569_003587 [Orbilia oligospora]|uniref:Alkaline phosphatase n=1 Tax=Orbilia oligospora TaxID=2813651 RepID=A0A7C8JKS5_ORBOL|nr:hypothetical protein TWF102_008447 [Orbilia oligospora]KAF3109552.1 hypothetical protein TWF706_001416 [Orbilia oligospora]KAF3114699.1 hypothetical protein TWF103_000436 [Orbilia oligospora]KAF3119206.1 hypothetical protein TWF703_003596 [Orbilia oligospora]KAF3119773.1 hypothetical protein TWF569_003587 [Orbilia oligospora]
MPTDRVLSPARHSGEIGDEQEEALLTGQHVDRKGQTGRGRGFFTRWKNPIIVTWAAIATIIILVFGVLYVRSHPNDDKPTPGAPNTPNTPNTPKNPNTPNTPNDPKAPKNNKKRNLIFMVSDGMGPASLSLTRSFRQFTENLPIDDILTLDKHFIGSSRTRSSNSLVTDSAAGATAFSCGLKSYNGAISILPDGNPCGTVLEAAKAAGYMTGLVVTTSITDATPACFNSHVNMRWEQDRIAEQQIGDHPLGRVTDLMFGGGLCHFMPNTSIGSCRGDDRDLIKEARKSGWQFAYTIDGFKYLRMGKFVKFPIMGLWAPADIPYDIDRKDTEYPSLAAMAETAITALELETRNSDKGFFLMIEGSRIDHAGHGNDPAAQVREVRAYDKAFEVVRRKIDEMETETIVISTSDHETGGLSTARQLHETYPDYLWYPSVLANASHSSEYMAKLLADFPERGKMKVTEYIKDELLPLQKITDADDEEVAKLVKAKIDGLSSAYVWADMISRRAQIGWSTHGHSAVDVNIYAYPPEAAKKLWGNHENTEIGEFLRNYLDVDVDAITKKLREGGTHAKWMGKELDEILEEKEKSMGVGGKTGEVTVNGLDSYHGVHKRACMH